PHFEKMLYDNAQLARVYLHAFQLSGDPLFARIARETLDYLVREMRDPDGGFWSAQDADSEGIEGKFFVWTPDEVTALLGDDAALFSAVFAVTPAGNFEDPHHPEFGRRTVLSRPSVLTPTAFAELAREQGLTAPALETKVDALRERMRLAREARIHPGLDDKVLTSWNGLALAAFAEAARVFDDDGYRAQAEQNAAFVRARMWRDGALLHTYKQGVARIDGLIEDYAYYALGLIELYRTSGELTHLQWAAELFAVALARFRADPADGGGFFESPADGEPLVLRPKPLFDAATPSGNGAMGQLGFWLGRYFERPEWEALGDETTALAGTGLTQAASGFGSMLLALELGLAPRRELAIVGPVLKRAPFEREVARHFLPAVVLAPADAGAGLPLLEERGVAPGAAAYVCADMVCALPALTPEVLAEQLAR
ncbi:MAG: thioredoxin domain-containing protein, partial [Chloroflexi bacterium]|nr:thioredoxin domain-containing protein [Chloroflexota bacterium]